MEDPKEPFQLDDWWENGIPKPVPESNIVTLSNGKTFYKLEGSEDGQLIVFLHGLGWGSYCFIKIASILKDNGFRVLLFGIIGIH